MKCINQKVFNYWSRYKLDQFSNFENIITIRQKLIHIDITNEVEFEGKLDVFDLDQNNIVVFDLIIEKVYEGCY